MEKSRRKFVKQASLFSSIAFISNSMNRNLLNVNEENAIVGHGDFKYRVDKTWGIQDPAKFPVNDCHEMVFDKKNRLFMTTTHPKNNVLVYDRYGKILDAWGTEFPGAHGLTLFDEGETEYLFITDPDSHKVCKTTLKGQILLTLEAPKEIEQYTSPDLFKPTETTIAPNGDIYVADGYGLDFIIQYDAKGNYIRHFGGNGKGEDQFECCHGVLIDTRRPNKDELLITSRSANEFKRFTLDGKHLETISMPGCWICRPVIKGEYLYFAVIVTKDWNSFDGMLAVLDEKNRIVSFPGGSMPMYQGGKLLPPKYDQKTFFNPHDVCIDGDLNLYIPQWNSNKTYPVKLSRV